MVHKKAAIQNILEQNTTNMVFYEDSFAKTAFFTKEISNWEIPIFYFDFDLQYTGFVKAGITPPLKNLTLLYPENGSLREDLKSVIEKISMKRSLIIIDSFNGFFNFKYNFFISWFIIIYKNNVLSIKHTNIIQIAAGHGKRIWKKHAIKRTFNNVY